MTQSWVAVGPARPAYGARHSHRRCFPFQRARISSFSSRWSRPKSSATLVRCLRKRISSPRSQSCQVGARRSPRRIGTKVETILSSSHEIITCRYSREPPCACFDRDQGSTATRRDHEIRSLAPRAVVSPFAQGGLQWWNRPIEVHSCEESGLECGGIRR